MTTGWNEWSDGARLLALLEAMPDGVLVFDADGRVLAASRRALEMFELEETQVVSAMAPFPWWPPEHREAMAPRFREALKERGGSGRLTFMRSSGERFPITIDIAPLNDLVPDGNGGFLAVIRDRSDEVEELTRRREAERVARMTSWEWSPAGSWVFDSSGLLDLAGLDRARVNQLEDFLALMSARDADLMRKRVMALVIGDADEFTLQHEVSVPNAEVVWMETRAQVVRDAEGVLVKVRGTTQDVSAAREAERALRESRELLQMAERVAGIGSFETDLRTGVARYSDGLYRILGLDREGGDRQIGEALAAVFGEDRDRVRAARDEIAAGGGPKRIESRWVRDGETRWAELRMEPLIREGETLGVLGTMQDITERREAEATLRLQAALLDSVDAGVIASDLEGRVTHWNRGAESLYGWSAEEMLGERVVARTWRPQQAELGRAALEAVEREGRWEGELDVLRKDGTTFPGLIRTRVHLDPAGQPDGYVTAVVDVSELVAAERRLRATGEYLRAVTDSIGEGVFTLDAEGALTYMNPAAEQLLGWRAEELEGTVMHEVTHAPGGSGDHSAAECPLTASREDTEPVRIDDDVFLRKDGVSVPVEYSSAPIEMEGGVEGSVVVFSDISERKARQLEVDRRLEGLTWMGRIRDALDNDRFVVYAQPIVELGGGGVIRYELLIRMLGPRGELILPGVFLPVAEEFAVIREIDRWMLGKAAELASGGAVVHVNVSAQSVGRIDLLDDLRDALRRNRTDPSSIVVELTETALFKDQEDAEVFTASLREIGCGLALDDFGTGYGGFSYIKRLPVDLLKIDREFVSDLTASEASAHVIKAVVSLAAAFGQRTVAEGIEDEATMGVLRDLGVDYAQGFHIARPAPAEDVIPGAGKALVRSSRRA